MGKHGQVSNKRPHSTICILTRAPIVLGISLSVTKDRKTRGHPLLLGYPRMLTVTLLVLIECRVSLQATQGLSQIASQSERGACPRGIHGPIDRMSRGCSGLSGLAGCDSMRDFVSRSSYLASEPGLIPFFFGVKLAGIDLFPLRCLHLCFLVVPRYVPTDSRNCRPLMYLYDCSSIFVFELSDLFGFLAPLNTP